MLTPFTHDAFGKSHSEGPSATCATCGAEKNVLTAAFAPTSLLHVPNMSNDKNASRLGSCSQLLNDNNTLSQMMKTMANGFTERGGISPSQGESWQRNVYAPSWEDHLGSFDQDDANKMPAWWGRTEGDSTLRVADRNAPPPPGMGPLPTHVQTSQGAEGGVLQQSQVTLTAAVRQEGANLEGGSGKKAVEVARLMPEQDWQGAALVVDVR